MSVPVCKKCGRPLTDSHSIAIGYGPKCARESDTELLELQTGIQVLSQMCFVMNTQAHSQAMLPELKIKIKPEEYNSDLLYQTDFLKDLFNEQN